MSQQSLPWDGIVLGDCGPYDSDEWSHMMKATLVGGASDRLGVIAGISLELFPDTAGTTEVNISPGRAIVNGRYYASSGADAIPIPATGGGTRIDRIVLRAAEGAQTVRLIRIPGAEGSGIPPAISQVDGANWDIKICQASINGAGDITVTDEREFFQPVSPVYMRQGGDVTNWDLYGVNNYIPAVSKLQCGSIQWAGAPAALGTIQITFPSPFIDNPIVIPTAADINLGMMTGNPIAVSVAVSGPTTAEIFWWAVDGVTTFTTMEIRWLAMGN
jgi:hypothetical protein